MGPEFINGCGRIFSMEKLDSQEIWRKIPPEEKYELIARAQSRGVFAVLITLIISGTIAVGLKFSPIFWTLLILSPFVFQYGAGRSWQGLRPKVMLEYLAARTAARRYAFALRGRDLAVSFIFKGSISRQFEQDEKNEELAHSLDHADLTQVWVVLFTDSLVIIKETAKGASMVFGHLINEDLQLKGQSPDGESEYSTKRELSIKASDQNNACWLLTSKYPAALVAFEKRFLQQQMKIQERLQELQDHQLSDNSRPSLTSPSSLST